MGFSKLQVAAEPKESTLPTKPSPSVRLCPHQTLSFDRLQRILALPNLMEERFRHKTVNALTATSSPPSHYLHRAETQICGPPPSQHRRLLHASPRQNSSYQNGDFRRLHLHSEWVFQPTRPMTRETTTTPKTPSAAFSTTPASGSARGRKLRDPLGVRAVYGRLVPASVEVPE